MLLRERATRYVIVNGGGFFLGGGGAEPRSFDHSRGKDNVYAGL